MTEDQMWQVTATVAALPRIAPREWSALAASAKDAPPARRADAREPDPVRGRRALRLYGCRSCHQIPGLVGRFDARVGPPLDDVGSRAYIAGVIANEPDAMLRWIMAPQHVDPLTAMPDLAVPEDAARDMAAYLYRNASDPRDACEAHSPRPDDLDDDGGDAGCVVGAGIEAPARR